MVPSNLVGVIWLFAEAAPDAPAAGNGGATPTGGLLQFLPPLIAMIGLFYFLIVRPEKRKQAEHKSLLEAVKKNDRVVTIGGIHGVVTNVQRDADRVTLKIDEANNTKIDVTFNAIARVIVEEQKTTDSK
ncbi:MAG: preprotein translocase subunit YajC [Pirellulales bacterium]|nr:preprotein translocase subunit YajC [Pirellulales bacterium]